MATRSMRASNPDMERNPNTMFIHVTRADRVQLGDLSYGVNDLEWLHGYAVDGVIKRIGPADGSFAIGDTILVKTLNGDPVYTFEVESIEMAITAEIDPTEAGYATHEEFIAADPIFDVPRLWLLRGEKYRA